MYLYNQNKFYEARRILPMVTVDWAEAVQEDPKL